MERLITVFLPPSLSLSLCCGSYGASIMVVGSVEFDYAIHHRESTAKKASVYHFQNTMIAAIARSAYSGSET